MPHSSGHITHTRRVTRPLGLPNPRSSGAGRGASAGGFPHLSPEIQPRDLAPHSANDIRPSVCASAELSTAAAFHTRVNRLEMGGKMPFGHPRPCLVGVLRTKRRHALSRDLGMGDRGERNMKQPRPAGCHGHGDSREDAQAETWQLPFAGSSAGRGKAGRRPRREERSLQGRGGETRETSPRNGGGDIDQAATGPAWTWSGSFVRSAICITTGVLGVCVL